MKFAVEADESAATGEWTRPGVFLVDEGVYRVVLPLPSDGLQAVNVYVLVDDDHLTVIDSGWSRPESRELLIAALDALDFVPTDISRFLITHMHRDHYEMSIAMRREFGVGVALGRGEEPCISYVLGPTFEIFGPQLIRLTELGAHDLADEIMANIHSSNREQYIELVEVPDEWLEAGEIKISERRVVNAVATPGHTQGHLVFHDESAQLLFSGDHVLPTITPSIGFEPLTAFDPLGDFLRSLAIVRGRPDARLLPAHGPLAPSVHARVDELLEHHDLRLAESMRALQRGYSSGLEVANQLGWTRRGRKYEELDMFNRMLAVSETGAHLQLLVLQGRARAEMVDGVRRFSPVD